MEAKLIYKRAQKGKDLLAAQIGIRVCQDWNQGYKLVATVIENRDGKQTTHNIVNINPKMLAIELADYVNEILRPTDTVWCSSELPEHTAKFAGCEAIFKDHFCNDVDAITDSERNMRRVTAEAKAARDARYKDWREWRTNQAKALIFGDKNDG